MGGWSFRHFGMSGRRRRRGGGSRGDSGEGARIDCGKGRRRSGMRGNYGAMGGGLGGFGFLSEKAVGDFKGF